MLLRCLLLKWNAQRLLFRHALVNQTRTLMVSNFCVLTKIWMIKKSVKFLNAFCLVSTATMNNYLNTFRYSYIKTKHHFFLAFKTTTAVSIDLKSTNLNELEEDVFKPILSKMATESALYLAGSRFLAFPSL